jgi:acyl-CoA thioester hydrolase
MEPFIYRKKIIESHLDTFGHMNNATYLSLFEEARWDFITSRNYGLDTIQTLQKGPVVLEVSVKYKKEIKNRDEIIIRSQNLGMKNKLVMELEQVMLSEDGTELASAIFVIGFMDMKKRKLITPTDEWKFAVGMTN